MSSPVASRVLTTFGVPALMMTWPLRSFHIYHRKGNPAGVLAYYLS
jgi:hypothetical protein